MRLKRPFAMIIWGNGQESCAPLTKKEHFWPGMTERVNSAQSRLDRAGHTCANLAAAMGCRCACAAGDLWRSSARTPRARSRQTEAGRRDQVVETHGKNRCRR